MKLSLGSRSEPSRRRDYLAAVEISDTHVKSALWTLANDKVQVVAVAQAYPWDGQHEDSLLAAADNGLSEAAGRVDASGQIQPEKVIFGLPRDWLDQEKISLSRTRFLKVICQKLSLRPVGFVISPEAIIQYLHQTEGVHPTAIVVGVQQHQLLVTLCHLGKIQGLERVVRSSKPAADLAEGLSRFLPADMLPSRILLYDSSSDLEDIRQQLLAFPWQAPQHRLPFLHFPKIDILPSDFSIKAVAIAGGSEVAKASGWLGPEKSPASGNSSPLGFTENTDIGALPSPPVPASTPTSPPAPIRSRRFLLPRLPRLPRLPALPKFRLSRLPVLLVLPAAVIILGLAYWYLPRADITLYLTPKSVTGQFEVLASPSSQSVSESILALKKIDLTSRNEKSLPTTGSVLVGDKATGTVNIINGTPVLRSFPAGTEIVSPGGQKFTLDEKITVASASGTADPNSYTPGKTSVAVTAVQIGSDSNLSAGTQFRINSFSPLDYVAKNDQAFSGGSTREAKAVSRQDLVSLRSQVKEAGSADIQKQLDSLSEPDQILISQTLKTEVSSETLNHKEGEIADEVNLQQSLQAVAYSYSQTRLADMVKSRVQSLYPEKSVPVGDPQYSIKIQKTDKDSWYLTVSVSSQSIPDIRGEEILPRIIGKKLSVAEQYLSELPSVGRTSVVLKPPLPDFLATLPRLSNHIRFTTQIISP